MHQQDDAAVADGGGEADSTEADAMTEELDRVRGIVTLIVGQFWFWLGVLLLVATQVGALPPACSAHSASRKYLLNGLASVAGAGVVLHG
jgi:hypothetical protein